MDVTLIGAGNVAWHLAPALDNCGFAVKLVYNTNPTSAKELVKRLYHAQITDSLDFSNSSSSLFLVCVPDDAIENIASEIILPENVLLAHTSGAQPASILETSAAEHLGVLYPLQSFSKSRKINLGQVPFLIEGNTKDSEQVLKKVASALSKTVRVASSEQRKKIHIAAVFANNFTNHMLTVSQQLMKEHQLDFDLLKPLIIETINKSIEIGPENAQTGPARRQDFQTLDAHIDLLDDDLRELYQTISQHILDHYS